MSSPANFTAENAEFRGAENLWFSLRFSASSVVENEREEHTINYSNKGFTPLCTFYVKQFYKLIFLIFAHYFGNASLNKQALLNSRFLSRLFTLRIFLKKLVCSVLQVIFWPQSS